MDAQREAGNYPHILTEEDQLQTLLAQSRRLLRSDLQTTGSIIWARGIEEGRCNVMVYAYWVHKLDRPACENLRQGPKEDTRAKVLHRGGGQYQRTQQCISYIGYIGNE